MNLEYDDLVAILKEIPSCIFFKDRDCKYVFATHYWHHLNQKGENWTIEGKTDLEIRKNKENAMKALEADKHILATGEMQDYVIREDGADGEEQYLRLIKKPVRNRNGEIIGIVGLINDVTKETVLQKQLDGYIQELKVASETDPLTGLLNRRSALVKFKHIANAKTTGVYCLMDVDEFKQINDGYGHDVGDAVLVQIAQALGSTFRDKDVVVRLGGDEFCVFLADVHDVDFADTIIQRFITKLKNVRIPEMGDKLISVSYGLAATTVDMPIKEMYKAADANMYEQKRAKKAL
ncbi:sensor domain-containing diguanylate cyclase [Fibrobacter sp. UWEL]|uniref:sensor domain-containing diguanylate cyclase n=1 Tax=Fibrobacter sp. UWEL TaxID=1896209 RepID=UPI000911C4B4|nr:sensor domain-containing diguanylate cyclase [Fibrobacter sp. UWEL]SHK35143.1 diguanylate cyclase (GGDEF) domain-containing protein [Fibrobacter sp. UWEL]